MRHIILISGKDSLATALVQTARNPDLPYEYVFNDVEAELPETYEWMDRVEKKTGWPVVRIGKSLPSRIEHYNGFLPGIGQRYCTKECKIEPTEKYIGTDDATVYYGLRADETRTGYVPIGKPNITPSYPLRDLGIGLQGVYAIVDAKGLTPPDFFWPRLHDAVMEKMGEGEWQSRLSRLERQLLFAGRTRNNCYFCFFQRRYEFLWLYETHPKLFEAAERMEKADYTFHQDFPLSSYRCPEVRERLFGRRVRDCCKIIHDKMQGKLFGEPGDNEIALTSCGLMCGK